MKSTKQRITILSGRIEKTLSSEGEILGFAGITRNLILDSLKHSYELVGLLDEFPETFEIVLLKRRLSVLFDTANKYLKDNPEEQSLEEFDEFLTNIANIHYTVKETYLIVSKEPLRVDAQLLLAKDRTIQINDALNLLKPSFNELKGLYDNSTAIINSILDQQKKTIEQGNTITDTVSKTGAVKKNVDRLHQTVQASEESINKVKNELITKNETGTALIEKLNIALKEIESLRDSSKNLTDQLQANITQNDSFQREIQKTIEDANRMGMAASFKRRKDELTIPYWFWSIATIVSIVALIGASFYVFTMFSKTTFDWHMFILRLPIFGAFIWLGWFCARQFGFTSRIREDYSYKYAVSMAFEGYKKEVRDVDLDLLSKLIRLTIQNISTNPLNIYETQSNHATPWNEWLSRRKLQNTKQSIKAVANQGSEHEKDEIKPDE